MTRRLGFVAPALLAACAGSTADVSLRSWGTMREALRDGQSQARVELADVAGPATVGVGAMAELAGEVTVVDGRVLVATAGAGAERPELRDARPGDAATMLVLDDVEDWRELPLGACADLGALERAIGKALVEAGFALDAPTPVRVRGRAVRLAVHVIRGACPIANPAGPSPWRFDGPATSVELVGFYVEGAAGRFTHHDRKSHLHAVSAEAAGHLDDVAFERAMLLLPAGRTR